MTREVTMTTVEELTTDITELIKLIARYNDRSGGYPVKGDVPRDSSLGTLLRLKWVSFTNHCQADCWDLYCPNPEGHIRKFKATSEGNVIAQRLDDTRVMRGMGH